MQIRRLVWLGTRTGRYGETTDFFRRVLGLEVVAEEAGLTIFRVPGREHDFVEVFDDAHPEAAVMTTGPVVGFLVDDVVEARAELDREGVELLGPIEWLRDYAGFEEVTGYGWFAFRAPDGNVYNCTQDTSRTA